MKILFASFAAVTVAAITGWVNHIIWSITTVLGEIPMTINEAVIAVVGAVVPPLGAIHGIYLWF